MLLLGRTSPKSKEYKDAVWDVLTRQEVATLDAKGPDYFRVGAYAFSPDGKYAVVGYLSKITLRWNLTTGTSEKVPDFGEELTAVAYSPDGKLFATAYRHESGGAAGGSRHQRENRNPNTP